MNKLLSLFLVLLLFGTNPCLAQPSSPVTSTVKNSSAPTITTATVPAPAALMSEKDYYRMMYERAATEIEAAHTATQWAFGIVIGVVTLIFAGQFLFNYQLNTSKLNAINNENRREAQALVSEAQRATMQSLSAESTANRTFIENRAQALDNQIRDAIKTESDNLKSSFTDLSNTLNSNFRMLRLEATDSEKYYAAVLDSLLNLAKTKITTTDIDQEIYGGITDTLKNVREISSKNFEELKRIMPIIGAMHHKLEFYLRQSVKQLAVYEYVPDKDRPAVFIKKIIKAADAPFTTA